MYAKTTLTALAVLLASTAFADPATSGSTKAGGSTMPSFTTLDANHDGSVSKTEAQSNSAVIAQWNTLDVDKNGSLSSAEYSAAAGKTGSSDDSTQ
jgi:hypothetical protein